jgi:hypothetical protein
MTLQQKDKIEQLTYREDKKTLKKIALSDKLHLLCQL